ncbi:hypothetical protein N9J52_04155 [Flavobacteriales bacterium]|nr:hypothetical protein [Flavobacteriales bacterium]
MKTPHSSHSLHEVSTTFCLARIVGNDLPPRHGIGQTYSNLKFILENEAKFEDCINFWVVNRIIDPQQESAILELLNEHNQAFIHLPFEMINYDLSWNLNQKINHAIQLNTARNIAIEKAQTLAKWTMMVDGAICFTKDGWDKTTTEVLSSSETVLKIKVYRLMKNNQEAFEFAEHKYQAEDEQMLVFTPEANIRFDEDIPYGRGEKRELLNLYPNAPLIGYSLRLFDYSKFGFIRELRSVQRLKAMEDLAKKVDVMYQNQIRVND